MVVGVCASAASTSARLVIDFDPGTATVARTGEAATGAGQGGFMRPRVVRLTRSQYDNQPVAPGSDGELASSAAGRELGLEAGDLACVARRVHHVVTRVLCSPGQTRTTFGVDGREHQAAEQAEVLEVDRCWALLPGSS